MIMYLLVLVKHAALFMAHSFRKIFLVFGSLSSCTHWAEVLRTNFNAFFSLNVGKLKDQSLKQKSE